ncbi:MAG: DUF4080 domain-containing protein, partial [Syntrophomonas sp.]|nr:DUF4080 domain-containing protein [Syntrophomonas sp.]
MLNTSCSDSIILATLNATYMHTSLALRALLAYTQPRTRRDLRIMEFTINQTSTDVMAALYRERPGVLAFSCYIWNIETISKLVDDYKKAAPETVIILGGPEVSSDAAQVLAQNQGVDFIVRGEGEATLAELVAALDGEMPLDCVLGITYREPDGNIKSNPSRPVLLSLEYLPYPYDHGTDGLTGRLIYYESSRGCPFTCSYCLSAASPGVRTLSLERVKSDLDRILRLPVREVKLVDRTFNLDEKRARAIMEHILAVAGNSQVHLEIDAGLLSDAMLDFLVSIPAGRFNFEIGVQSTHPPTLQAVRRKQNWKRLSENISRLVESGKIHIHLDLIAGLPGEDLASFKKSFNMVYNLRPHLLQLGFLKILKGSPLAQECQSLSYAWQSHPPYQIISNPHLTYEDVLTLTRMEQLLDWYYNSGQMATTVEYIATHIYQHRPADFYQDLAGYWEHHGWWGRGQSQEALYTYLSRFIDDEHHLHLAPIQELLKYDYLLKHHRYTL